MRPESPAEKLLRVHVKAKGEAMRLTRRALTGALFATLFYAAPAVADTPLIVDEVRFDPAITELDPLFTETCGFPVMFSAKGHFRGTVYFNADGSFRGFVGHPSVRRRSAASGARSPPTTAASTRSA